MDHTRPSQYAAVTPVIVEELKAIVGASHLIAGDPEAMQDYSHDEVAGEQYARMPEVVVKPGTTEQVSQIMKLANRERIPVTPRGAGSGLSCGAVPAYGGILVSSERMNRILEIDRENLVVVAQAGVVTNDINDAVEPYGLFYAGYPMSLELCFIGGNVAENAGGGRAIKYGVTGRYVLGLEVVLANGDVIRLGGRRVKDVTGYDLIHLLVGSEGTLGIFTEITLRLVPRPTARAVLLVPFEDTGAAIGAVPRVMTRGRIVPTSVEFMDHRAIQAAYDYTGERLPHPDVGAMLLIEIDGTDEDRVERDVNSIIDLCLDEGALDIFVGNTPRDERRMWRPRQAMAEALKAICPVQSLEDIVVPLAQIPELIPELDHLSEAHDVLIPCYGHAGDGNLHATVVKKPETPHTHWEERLPQILEELYQVVARLGGTISGEHGIGSKRARYLPLVLDDRVIVIQRGIKAVFDPNGILNPGKIFPPE